MKIFVQVLLPLLVPAIASFAIFQFLWVWNDLLVALTFSGQNTKPITAGIQNLTTQFSNSANILPAAAVHRDVGAAGGVPLAATVLRQRHAGRRGQGLTAG